MKRTTYVSTSLEQFLNENRSITPGSSVNILLLPANEVFEIELLAIDSHDNEYSKIFKIDFYRLLVEMNVLTLNLQFYCKT